MSTWLYLECTDHTPAIRSEDVGQHLYDLPQIREDLRDRRALIARAAEGRREESHFKRNTAAFLLQHPRCTIRIIDEYGEEHAATERARIRKCTIGHTADWGPSWAVKVEGQPSSYSCGWHIDTWQEALEVACQWLKDGAA